MRFSSGNSSVGGASTYVGGTPANVIFAFGASIFGIGKLLSAKIKPADNANTDTTVIAKSIFLMTSSYCAF
jgi:hypothetical protein